MGIVARRSARIALVLGTTLAPLMASQLVQAQDLPVRQTAAVPSITSIASGVELREGARVMRIVALTDDILRIRIARDGTFPEDASWAVPTDVRAERATVKPAADGFTTGHLRVRLVGSPARLVVETLDGKVISADAAEPMRADGQEFTLRKALPQSEHYFGLGDKTGGMDRRGKSFVDWNTDSFGYSSSDDPIYKSIPFFIGVGGAGGSYGIFLDNTWRTWFDFGHRDADVLAFGGPDGPIDYYVINGPSTAQVVRRYTDLTGKAPLTPEWALGYQQSRYSYMSADEVRQVAARLRADKVPTDVLWLDIDFQDRNRPFTVNKQTFPDLKGLISDVGKEGFKVVTITDLHVAHVADEGYLPYDSGKAINAFVHDPAGSTYVAPVWPGPSVFPDFTDARVREWWGGLFQQEVADGVAGAWNDMNEPAVFDTPTKTMPLDTVHHVASDDFTTRDATHREIHNVYGMENTRATYDGLRKLNPNERAFVMTRASYAGGQRWSVTWTGDNSASWDHLKLSVQQIINLGLSGFSYSAADVSGFAGGPSADLLTRWFEIGAFYPVFRDHSAKGEPRVEPWVDGPDHLAIRRRWINERYRLLPYLYALADQNARTGDPIMRPVFYDYPAALSASCDQSWAFTVGRSLLVTPPPKPESPESYKACLPAGNWYDYWTGQPVTQPAQAGGTDQPVQSASQATGQAHAASIVLTETPRLDYLPVFVRAGTILPRQSVVQSTAETPTGPLMLDVYPGDDCRGELYADDGHSVNYTHGVLMRQTLRCTVTPSGVTVELDKRDGSYHPWWKQIAVTVHGWTGAGSATIDGKATDGIADAQAGTMMISFNDTRSARRIAFVNR